MPEVYAWPPVTVVGHENTIDRPAQLSRNLSGAAKFSQTRKTRRLVSARVSGIGVDGAGAGYVEMLKRYLDGKLPLVRMTVLPSIWMRNLDGLAGLRGKGDGITWSAGGVGIDYRSGPPELRWRVESFIYGRVGAENGGIFLDCEGLPPNRVVAWPSEIISIEGLRVRVRAVARSDGDGNARILIDGPGSDGEVSIGVLETVVFVIDEFPRAQQPQSGDFAYDFALTEAFPEDYGEEFKDVNPWM